MKIAFAGNPNSGKTTMYNALTGSNERVGNWAGVTVDKKQRAIKSRYLSGVSDVVAVDLPGTYSISPFTSEESVTRDYILNERPDILINIVDATNLSRSLFFTTQLLELGIPTVVALNKSDINEKKQTEIDAEALSKELGCPVVETDSTRARGLKELVKVAISLKDKKQSPPYTEREEDHADKKSALKADIRRFSFVNRIVEGVETRKVASNKQSLGDKIDKVITNKWAGIPIFAVIMFFVFQISQNWLGNFIANGAEGTSFPGLVGYISEFKEVVAGWMSGASSILKALVLEGMIEGVSAVLGFLPLVMVMYFLIALLEDCGYMARVSVVLDPIFKKVGLSGKSVIPFVIGTGCAVPGVMAVRTIRNERERRATALLAPFMPCGAKLPVISLFVGAFFPGKGFVGTLMYFVGILIILLGALLINLITGVRKKKSYFVIELPEYKIPSFSRAFFSMCSRGWSYIVKAGTVILVCNFVVYLMQNYSWSLTPVTSAEESILKDIATPFAYLFAPVFGVVAWKLAASVVTGFIAKECVVSTLATCYLFTSMLDEEGLALAEGLSGTSVAGLMPLTAVSALAFLMFNLFTPPCFAAIGAMSAELGSKKWLFGGIGLQLSFGFVISFMVFFFGTLITGGSLGEWWMPTLGWMIAALIVAVYGLLIVRANKRLRKEAEIKNKKINQKVTV